MAVVMAWVEVETDSRMRSRGSFENRVVQTDPRLVAIARNAFRHAPTG